MIPEVEHPCHYCQQAAHQLWIHGGAQGIDSQVESFARAFGIQTIIIRPDYAHLLPKAAPLKRIERSSTREIYLWLYGMAGILVETPQMTAEMTYLDSDVNDIQMLVITLLPAGVGLLGLVGSILWFLGNPSVWTYGKIGWITYFPWVGCSLAETTSG